MGVRRVVTGDVDGRSRVVIDGDAPHSWCDELWMTDGNDPMGGDPAKAAPTLEPPKGGTRWRMVSLSPDAEMRAALADGGRERVAGIDPDGFHRTATIDYVYVLDGDLTLELDDGESVLLHPGDCVIQRGTNHAWRNHNDHPVRILAVMVSA